MASSSNPNQNSSRRGYRPSAVDPPVSGVNWAAPSDWPLLREQLGDVRPWHHEMQSAIVGSGTSTALEDLTSIILEAGKQGSHTSEAVKLTTMFLSKHCSNFKPSCRKSQPLL